MSATTTQVGTRQTPDCITFLFQVISEKEWIKFFPKQVTENYTSSVTFMKQLTVVAMSTITYLKNVFPEESYNTDIFAGLKLRLLKEKCVDDMAQFVSSALKNAFEAFDKKYVQQLALCFYDGDCVPENLLEYYMFEYTYNSEGMSLNINSKTRNNAKSMRCSLESVQNKTLMFVRALSLFIYANCQDLLPLNYDITLRIYYNEDAPEDYQAPGFIESTGPDPVSDTLRSSVRLGHVETPHHQLVARTYVRGLIPDAEPSDTQLVDRRNDSFEDESMKCEVNSESSLQPSLQCPCGKQDAREQVLITCRYCHTQQHAICFGLMAPVKDHCCATCAKRDPSRKSTCPFLKDLEGRKQECICIFRRTLVMCLHQSSISGEELMAKFNLQPVSTNKMIRLLISHLILPNIDPTCNNLTIARNINPIRLKLACKKFFQMEQDNIVDRVLAETEASDPVEEALSPIEKITLRETNLGTVINKPEKLNMTPLKEFSDVELPNQDISEELPLSGSHNPVNVPRPEKKLKRKKVDDEDWTPKLPKLRSGATKNKRP
ncbi:uncharacterized protein LOC134753468 [Cydia strobilella]|uniref:uncharacterized protein LOC134753468 n=1 Tax=Cydia strobilella TaxID=1100964 RepID=UPI003003F549